MVQIVIQANVKILIRCNRDLMDRSGDVILGVFVDTVDQTADEKIEDCKKVFEEDAKRTAWGHATRAFRVEVVQLH